MRVSVDPGVTEHTRGAYLDLYGLKFTKPFSTRKMFPKFGHLMPNTLVLNCLHRVRFPFADQPAKFAYLPIKF